MGQNTLPPGTETFLSNQTGSQLNSALTAVYSNIMVDTAIKEHLTQLGIDIGVDKPTILFSDDDLWRAVVKAFAFNKRHIRNSVIRLFELILGPQISRVTTLDRTTYAQILVGDTINVTSGTYAGSSYTVSEVLTHHLIFPAGTFAVLPEIGISYNIRNTSSEYGDIIDLSDGRQALVDTTVSFTNNHLEDFLTALNKMIPQYGKVIFNKNSPTTEETFNYDFYDRYLTGILKLDADGTMPLNTRNRWVPMRSSTLSASAQTGDLSVSILNSTNFPASAALVQTIQLNVDSVTVTTPGLAVGPLLINGAVSKHEISLAAPGFIVPASPSGTPVQYEIDTGGTGFLNNNRGHFISSTGSIVSTTRLIDYSVDFTALLRPQIAGTTEPFSVVINKGEDNEETVEVLSRSGNTLTLVNDPNDSTGATSLLKYNHDKGEPIQVANKNTDTTASYYPLTAAGATIGTATAGSTVSQLVDATAVFVALNADATYGDEVELVTVPAGSINKVGERRTITNLVGATTVDVSPAFADTLLGCTYKVRKLYKAGSDNFLYVEDSSVFPAGNFSAIINRGKDDEEVVWCGAAANNLTLNRLAIANNDVGTAFVSKKHDFGVTVEPAQVLIPGCNWDVIETRATGEFTLAVEGACVPAMDATDAWFLHESTPTWLMSDSSTGAEIATGVAGTGGIPQGALTAGITAGVSSLLSISLDDFLRVFGNKPDANNLTTFKHIFRPGMVFNVNNKEEFFATTVLNAATLMEDASAITLAGTHTIVIDKYFPGSTVLTIGTHNNKYPVQVETLTMTAADAVSLGDGKFSVTFDPATPLKYSHFTGESVLPSTLDIKVTRPFENSFAAADKVVMLTAHPAYRHLDNITTASAFTTLGATAKAYVPVDPGSGSWFPSIMAGKEVFVRSTPAGAAPQGERRKIIAVGGADNNYLFVSPEFSANIPAGAVIAVESVLQTGDLEDSRVVPLGDANSAFPVALNNKNLNMYSGGHKSVFPGSYIYAQTDDDVPVDQPTSHVAFLRTSYDVSNPDAICWFPGPRRLITKPLVPWTKETALGGTVYELTSVDIVGLTTSPVGRYVEILGPITSKHFRKLNRINAYDNVTGTITCDDPFIDSMITVGAPLDFRIMGDPAVEALIPGPITELWVDYPDFFPATAQNNFKINIGRGTLQEQQIDIINCNPNVGLNYGKFTVTVTSPPLVHSYGPGTSVELVVTKISLDPAYGVGTMPELGGGFYCGFGFDTDKYVARNIGLGHPSDATTEKYEGGAESKGKYLFSSGSVENLQHKKYTVSNQDLALPIPSTRSVAFRSTLSSASINNPTSTRLFINGYNFLHQKYKDVFERGTVQIFIKSTPNASYKTYNILDIYPGTSEGCVLVISPVPEDPSAPGTPIVLPAGTTVIVRGELRVDDSEAKLKSDAYVALVQSSGASPLTLNYDFTSLTTTALSPSADELHVNTIQPISTALIGRAVKITDIRNIQAALVGQVRTIVDIKSTTANPASLDIIQVDTPFTAPPNNALTFSILPSKDIYYGSAFSEELAGGVYTPLCDPYGLMGTPPFSGNTKFPAGREYGIIQEYIEYESRTGNGVLTLAEPYYFKYDHPPGTKINFGSNVTVTAGDGSDYSPFISSMGYLGVLFSDAVGFKNLFTAAGIECKTEETELGP